MLNHPLVFKIGVTGQSIYPVTNAILIKLYNEILECIFKAIGFISVCFSGSVNACMGTDARKIRVFLFKNVTMINITLHFGMMALSTEQVLYC